MKLLTFNNNLVLMSLFTANNSYLPLVKMFTINKIFAVNEYNQMLTKAINVNNKLLTCDKTIKSHLVVKGTRSPFLYIDL